MNNWLKDGHWNQNSEDSYGFLDSAIKSQFRMQIKNLKFENVNTTLQLDPKSL